MKRDYNHEIALMRYQIISPMISNLVECSSVQQFFNTASKKGIRAPDGSIRYFSVGSIERWYYKYKKGGFDALIPKRRVDSGKSRKLDNDLKNQIVYYKTHYPRTSATAIYNTLLEKGVIRKYDISLSTITRYINHLSTELNITKNQDMRRYEREHINEVWCGDTCVALWLKTDNSKSKQRVYVIALIDDASRFIVGADVFFNDNFINLMKVLKSSISKYGRPQMLNFDNGSSYRNNQMELLAARIGTTLHYNHPYTPTQKAKIERWFRTMREHWVATLNLSEYHNLDELKKSLDNYVNTYNNSPHSSLNEKTPKERYFSEPNMFKRLSTDLIDKYFLLEIERKVTADCIICIDQVEYEVDYKYARQKIKLRYSPDLKEIFVVNKDNSLSPIRLLNKVENSKIKREKIHLCEGDELEWTTPQDTV